MSFCTLQCFGCISEMHRGKKKKNNNNNNLFAYIYIYSAAITMQIMEAHMGLY